MQPVRIRMHGLKTDPSMVSNIDAVSKLMGARHSLASVCKAQVLAGSLIVRMERRKWVKTCLIYKISLALR